MSEYELYHIDDSGRKVNCSDKQKELANEAKNRSAEKIAQKAEEDSEITEDKYMAELYSKDHDEYLVNGAILQCNMATTDFKLLQGKGYNAPSPSRTTILNDNSYSLIGILQIILSMLLKISMQLLSPSV